MFAQDGNVEKSLVESLEASIADRKATICDTWDEGAVMALPWGVKEPVAIDHADAVSKYMESVDEVEVNGQKAKILKAGVKERNGEATLIYRYQLV